MSIIIRVPRKVNMKSCRSIINLMTARSCTQSTFESSVTSWGQSAKWGHNTCLHDVVLRRWVQLPAVIDWSIINNNGGANTVFIELFCVSYIQKACKKKQYMAYLEQRFVADTCGDLPIIIVLSITPPATKKSIAVSHILFHILRK